MRKLFWLLPVLILAFSLTVCAQGETPAKNFTLAEVFTDNMVLQADKPIVFWGECDEENAAISVCLDDEVLTTHVRGGTWEVTFPARPADSTPFVVQVMGDTEGEQIFLENIVIGDVWIVMGQSNVEYNVTALNEWPEMATRVPKNARCITYTSLDLGEEAPRGARTRIWKPMTIVSAAQTSALGYCIVDSLAAQTGHQIPIGLISAGFRGQDLAAFLPSHLAEKMDAVDEKSIIYEKVIRHFDKLPFRGLVWYQGEANGILYEEYTEKFSAFIAEWREKAGHFPVYAVELPPCFKTPEGGDPTLRQYLDFGTVRGVIGTLPLYLSDTVLCPTSDLWTDRDYNNNLHPNNKPAVASRVAGAVFSLSYDMIPREDAVAPQITDISFGENAREVLLTYDSMLTTYLGGPLLGFSLIDAKWNPVDVEKVALEGNRVRITAADDVAIVRYGADDEDVFSETLTLVGKTGLPAPALWYQLAEMDSPSFFSRLILFAAHHVIHHWYIILAILVVGGGVLYWWIKKRRTARR